MTQSVDNLNNELEAQRARDQIGVLVTAARIALRRGKPDEARAKLKQVFALDASDRDALELLGDLFMEDGEQAKALRVFERGASLYPKHRAFEEKAALAHLDLEEMRRDQERRADVLQTGARDKLLDRKPGVAFGFSLMVPGVGQFYNGENERGAMFFGGALVLFVSWFFPLTNAIKAVTAMNVARGGGSFRMSAALAQLGDFGRALLFLTIAAWVGAYVWSAVDAMIGAERVNELRRRGSGLLME